MTGECVLNLFKILLVKSETGKNQSNCSNWSNSHRKKSYHRMLNVVTKGRTEFCRTVKCT